MDPVEPEPTAEPAPPTETTTTASPSPAVEPTTAAPTETPDDLTALQAELKGETWSGQVTGVTRNGEVIVVETSLVDPAQESSAEGMIAGTVCNAAERAFGDDWTVQVRESDGTTFATNQFGQCEEY